jgi:hypothetical protein
VYDTVDRIGGIVLPAAFANMIAFIFHAFPCDLVCSVRESTFLNDCGRHKQATSFPKSRAGRNTITANESC